MMGVGPTAGRSCQKVFSYRFRTVVAILSDRAPNFRSVLPFVEKDWLLIGKEQLRRRFCNSKISITALLVLKLNYRFASLFCRSRLSAAFCSNDVDRVEGLDSFIYYMVYNSMYIFHELALLLVYSLPAF